MGDFAVMHFGIKGGPDQWKGTNGIYFLGIHIGFLVP